MDFLQLTYFKTIAEEKSVTKAAQKLCVSQPALSKMLKNLENEFGVKLFFRTGQGVELNTYGRVVLSYARKILDSASDAVKEVSDLANLKKKQCVFSMTAATRILPDLIRSFKDKYPDIDIICNSESIGEPAAKAEFYITSSLYPVGGMEVLLKEECVLCVPEGHPLAHKKRLAREDILTLKNERFLCLQKNRPLYTLVRQLCQDAGFEPHIALECDNSETILSLVSSNMGVALIPFETWKRGGFSKKVSIVHVNDDFCRYILMYKNRDRYESDACKECVQFITEYFATLK